MGRFEINSRKPLTFEVAVNRVVSQTLAVELISRATYHLLKSTYGSANGERLRSIFRSVCSISSCMAWSAASRRFQNTSEASERETAIDDDGLAIDHGGSDTQEHNHVRDILRRAGALQKGALDYRLSRLFRPTPCPFCVH
jgi:hypothetical protein